MILWAWLNLSLLIPPTVYSNRRNFCYRLQEVSELGKQLMLGNPNINDVKERLARLDTENALVQQGFEDKGRWLKQCLNLQLLNKEADHIDTTTSSHEAFLEFSELGVSRYFILYKNCHKLY